jgi:DNA-binding NarL/FixJ family response regulator
VGAAVTVDAATLGHLRSIVHHLHSANAEGTSLTEVVKLARQVELEAGVTVDFDATPELGLPLVVVRVPADPPTRQIGLSQLTPREGEVVALIATGLSNKQIALRLGLTLGTVKYYVHQILEKTELPSRVAIATSLRRASG